jgi:uncharacterized protein (DUF111 family)
MKKRKVLKRELITVDTPWGKAHVKVRMISEDKKIISPEYDDCKKLAKKNRLPIQEIYEAIRRIASERLDRS